MVIFVAITMSFNVAAGATGTAPFLLQQAWAQIQSSNDGAIMGADEGSNNNNNNSRALHSKNSLQEPRILWFRLQSVERL
jgi:hypothetical protein